MSLSLLTKTIKTLFKSFALRALVCHRPESGCKYTYTIFQPITYYVLVDIKTFEKKNLGSSNLKKQGCAAFVRFVKFVFDNNNRCSS